MAGGPVKPDSAFPEGDAFRRVHVGGGAQAEYDVGMGVGASLAADATWHLRFEMPPSLPTGTGKLRLRAISGTGSGNARVNPKWASVALSEDPSGTTMNAEGAQTITFVGVDDYLETKIDLDADTLTASEIVVMELVFETASWTHAAISTWQASIIWE